MLCGGFSAVGLRVRGARWWYRGLQARRLRHRSVPTVPTNRRWRADRAIQIVTVLARGRVTSQAGGGSARKVLLARACLGKLAIGCWALRRACSSPSARGEWGSTWLRTAGCSTQHRAPRHLACVQVAGHARDRPRCPERSWLRETAASAGQVCRETVIYTGGPRSFHGGRPPCPRPPRRRRRRPSRRRSQLVPRRGRWQPRLRSMCRLGIRFRSRRRLGTRHRRRTNRHRRTRRLGTMDRRRRPATPRRTCPQSVAPWAEWRSGGRPRRGTSGRSGRPSTAE
jgi:hypothetical protein